MIQALKKKWDNQRGFTLVELLAVIVILGIIAAIAVPSIGKIIDNSKDDAALQDAIQIINAAKLAHTADPAISTWTNKEGLKDYLTNADDETFVVEYSDGVFTIRGHEKAVKVLGASKNRKITESELIKGKLLE
ncbi:type II secretion system protein [Bacillus sp. REN3]|uniref:type II secretion system protein n=1 Tax=Bacillus sp. REN3 TaxID=2802440 RepID=UPI001AED2B60|nr:type II secretion system protein [Bacillus sp. REN3]